MHVHAGTLRGSEYHSCFQYNCNIMRSDHHLLKAFDVCVKSHYLSIAVPLLHNCNMSSRTYATILSVLTGSGPKSGTAQLPV